MIVADTKRRQAVSTISRAAHASEEIRKPMGGWIALFQSALGISSTQLAKNVNVSRNSLYKSVENEKAGTISLNQLSKIADAMDGRLIYAIVPKQGDVKDIIMQQARKKAKRTIMRARAHMALEEQSEGLRTQDEMIEELAIQMARELRRDFWS
ncbi:MAG: helix-turn-helix domain-containing protein [Proteobacteria bacterium]|nr:helix-turn-helix domain-containing protein [Pseudomonadota bacterium]